MLSRILRIMLVCSIIGLISSSLTSQQSLAATGDDYYVYSKFNAPGTGLVWAAGGYVEYYGVPEWGDEIQYVYFLQREGSRTIACKVKVWVTNEGSAADPTPYIDIRQHPDHPTHTGPIEPRHFEIVSSFDITEYADTGDWASDEFYVDSTGVYLGAWPHGINKWDHDWNHIGQIAPVSPPSYMTQTLAYDPARNVWYAGGAWRDILQLSDTDGDGDFMDETWQYIFTTPDYAGSHHDGMEYVGGYLWISDMTSDVIAKWQYDDSTDTWTEVGRYTYTEAAVVEGMGFGPNDHFWIGGYNYAYIYELGNEITKGYPLAEAGPDVPNHAPTIPITFDASGSHHTDPSKQIVLYEWDFEGDGFWDYTGTDPKVEHTYPAYYNPDDSVDWGKTAKDYPATLRVTDNSDPALQDTDTCIVHITAPPWQPVSDPGGPYGGVTGVAIQLDGSESYDPESRMVAPGHPWYETIAKYEWDLDYDGEFDDSTDVKPSWTWGSEGIYIVSLRVTDSQPSGPGGTVGPLDVDVKHATVLITKQKPPTTKIETHEIDSVNGTAKFTWSGSDDTTPATELTYSYRLVRPGPAYDAWSTWSAGKTKEYTDLSPGSYKFQVRAKDADEAIDPSPASREFAIGEGAPGTIKGRVTDASIPGPSNGIFGAVLLLDPDPFVWCYTTDVNGNFSFSIPAGTYDITASAEGYESQTKRVTVTAEELAEVIFDLSPYPRMPVIIIPGIAGSYLENQLSGDLIWNPDNWVHCMWELETDKCLRDPGCSVTSYDIGHHYEPLWKALKDQGYGDPVRLLYPFSKSQDWTGANLFLFCYDWRQDLVVIAAHLRWAIEWILEHSSAPHVDIVAHSMGGLVARCYINRSIETAISVRKLLLLGAPNYGTTSAYLLLHPELGCYNVEIKLTCRDFIAEALKDLPGPYQLLPTTKFFRDLYPYVFIDNWIYSAPGEPANDAEGELRSWELTYKTNPDSRLANLNLVEQARSRHEETLGETLRFDGEVYLFVGTDLGTPHYVTKEGQVIYTSPPSSSTPAVSVTHWDVYLENGDKRVLARSAAWLEVESNAPQKCIFTVPKADHAGELIKSSGVLNLIREVLSNPYSPVACSFFGGHFEAPDFPPQEYDKIRLSSPATLSVYNLDGELLAGPSEDCDCYTITKETNYFVLEDTKIAIVPDGLAYSVKIVGTGKGTFTLELDNCRGDITLTKYIFSDIPITSNTVGSMMCAPGSGPPPELNLDLDGDGTIDQSIPAQPGNTLLGSSATLSFYDGLVSVAFGEITSAGHTVCGSVDSLEGLNPSIHPVTPFYWLTTSARFSDPVSITIQYDETNVPTGRESDLKLYRISGEDAIKDITQQLDQAANTVTGQTDGFSYFVVGYMSASPETSILSPTTGDTVTGQSCRIDWQATDPDNPASSLSIDLFYSTNGGTTWTSIASSEANDGIYDWDISALHGGEYWLKVVAKDPEEGTSEATVGPFTIVTLAGNVIVAPNPVTGASAVFFYTLPDGTSTTKLMIFNIAGRPVFETPLDADSARFPNAGTWNPVDQVGIPLANGPYIYVLIVDGKVIDQGKMVIQR